MQSTPNKQAWLESPGELTEHGVKQDRHQMGPLSEAGCRLTIQCAE
jgi:hypothetical protein